MNVYEVLLAAQINLNENGGLGAMLAKEQLNNAMTLLENGYGLSDEYDENKIDEIRLKKENE